MNAPGMGKGKLWLGLYPYTYARVSVMKGELINRMQWQGMLKMGVNEILRNLQDGAYAEEINEIGAFVKGSRDLAALEMVLNRNLMRVFEKLRRISDEKVQEVMHAYMERYDIENFKTVIRSIITGISAEEAETMLLPSINYPKEYFTNMLKQDNLLNALDMVPFADELGIKFGQGREPELFEIENSIDRTYFERLFAFSRRLAGQGKAMREFIGAEIEIINIKSIVRLKKEGMGSKDLKKYLIHPSEAILGISALGSIREIMDKLYKMDYTSVKGDEAVQEEELAAQLEIDLDTALLRREALLMHKYPLTVNVILGFMLAKEIEIRNLKVLLKGKQLGLEEEYITKLLAVA